MPCVTTEEREPMSPKKLAIGAAAVVAIGFFAQSCSDEGTACKGVKVPTAGDAAANISSCLTDDTVKTVSDPSIFEELLAKVGIGG